MAAQAPLEMAKMSHFCLRADMARRFLVWESGDWSRVGVMVCGYILPRHGIQNVWLRQVFGTLEKVLIVTRVMI